MSVRNDSRVLQDHRKFLNAVASLAGSVCECVGVLACKSGPPAHKKRGNFQRFHTLKRLIIKSKQSNHLLDPANTRSAVQSFTFRGFLERQKQKLTCSGPFCVAVTPIASVIEETMGSNCPEHLIKI